MESGQFDNQNRSNVLHRKKHNSFRYIVPATSVIMLALGSSSAAQDYYFRYPVAGVQASDAISYASCALPWGGTLEHEQSTIAYQAPSIPFGETCSSETLTCSDGTLDGTFQYASCVEDAQDMQPDPFTIAAAEDVQVGEWIESGAVHLTGFNGTVSASVTATSGRSALDDGPHLRVNEGSWATSVNGIKPGDSINLRIMPGEPGTTYSIKLAVGSTTGTWEVTSEVDPMAVMCASERQIFEEEEVEVERVNINSPVVVGPGFDEFVSLEADFYQIEMDGEYPLVFAPYPHIYYQYNRYSSNLLPLQYHSSEEYQTGEVIVDEFWDLQFLVGNVYLDESSRTVYSVSLLGPDADLVGYDRVNTRVDATENYDWCVENGYETEN